MKTVHFIQTGGTIDSAYDGRLDTATPLKESSIPAYVDSLRLYEDVTHTTVCMKDSRQLDESDIRKVQETIEESPHALFIVTHGTYTMPDTARFLKENLRRKDVTVILTGSMIPLTGFSPSYAGFNLGYSLSEVQHLEPGIYVSMHGRIFAPEEVRKDLAKGRFSSIFMNEAERK